VNTIRIIRYKGGKGSGFTTEAGHKGIPKHQGGSISNFNKWFGNSKMVLTDGSPAIYYHGTFGDFTEFDISKTGLRDEGVYGKGFYFAQNPEHASSYVEGSPNANVRPVYLKIENPYNMQEDPLKVGNKEPEEISNILKENGYDGVIAYKKQVKFIEDEKLLDYASDLWESNGFDSKQDFQQYLSKSGVDTHVFNSLMKGYEGDTTKGVRTESVAGEVVAFYPTQVKSVFNTKFNPKSLHMSKEISNIVEKGGAGSGFKGHKGRIGIQGGSAPDNISNNFTPGTPASTSSDLLINKINRVVNEELLGAPVAGRYEGGKTHKISKDLGGLNDDDRMAIKDTLVKDISNILMTKGIYTNSEQAYADVNQMIRNWASSANDNDIRSLSAQYAASLEFGLPMSEWQKEQFAKLGTMSEIIKTLNMRSDFADEIVASINEAFPTRQVGMSADEYRSKWVDFNEYLDGYIKDYSKSHNLLPVQISYFERIANGIKEEMLGKDLYYYRQSALSQYTLGISKQRAILRAMYENTQEAFSKVGMKPDDTVILYRGFNSQDIKGLENTRMGDEIGFVGNVMESWTTDFEVAMMFASSRGETAHTHDYVLGQTVPVRNIIGTARTGYGCIHEYELVPFGNIPGTKVRIMSHVRT